MKQAINIVSFDVPYPPNYGGVIDVFYKIEALVRRGVEVHLHAYQYGRAHSAELEKICASVHYYQRKKSVMDFMKTKPFIVATRNNASLIKRLRKNDFPILLEGLHCCAVLEEFAGKRAVYVRTHNVEHDYYQGLAESESNFAKRQYFTSEAKKLLKYESILSKANGIAAISEPDKAHFLTHNLNAKCVPAFHSNTAVQSKVGHGDYVLYHGNLAVRENEYAVEMLLQHVAPKLELPMVIAGANPSAELEAKIEQFSNVRLEKNVSQDRMTDLIQNAHINLLPTFQSTGIKLKLINALYQGRHCLVTPKMVEGIELNALCNVADLLDWPDKIKHLLQVEFTVSEIEKRKVELESVDLASSLEKLYNLIFH